MNRREVLTAIGGSVYALDARAQPSGQVRRIEKQAKMMGLSVLSLKLTSSHTRLRPSFQGSYQQGRRHGPFFIEPILCSSESTHW